LAAYFSGEKYIITVLEGALFTGLFLLLIRLKHTFGVGASVFIPSLIVTALTLYEMSVQNTSYSTIFAFICFFRYCGIGFVFLVSLAISGRRSFLNRVYNGVVSGSIVWFVGAVGILFASSSTTGIDFILAQFFLGAAMGLYLMIATSR